MHQFGHWCTTADVNASGTQHGRISKMKVGTEIMKSLSLCRIHVNSSMWLFAGFGCMLQPGNIWLWVPVSNSPFKLILSLCSIRTVVIETVSQLAPCVADHTCSGMRCYETVATGTMLWDSCYGNYLNSVTTYHQHNFNWVLEQNLESWNCLNLAPETYSSPVLDKITYISAVKQTVL